MTYVERLAEDFKRWGAVAVERVKRLTEKYGVLCSQYHFSSGRAG